MFEELNEKLKTDPKLRKYHQREKLILDVTEFIVKHMEKNKINKTRLAGLLGVGNSYITQLLDGTSNMTLGTVSDVFFVLDLQLNVSVIPLSFDYGQSSEYENVATSNVTGVALPEDWPEQKWIPNEDLELAA